MSRITANVYGQTWRMDGPMSSTGDHNGNLYWVGPGKPVAWVTKEAGEAILKALADAIPRFANGVTSDEAVAAWNKRVLEEGGTVMNNLKMMVEPQTANNPYQYGNNRVEAVARKIGDFIGMVGPSWNEKVSASDLRKMRTDIGGRIDLIELAEAIDANYKE